MYVPSMKKEVISYLMEVPNVEGLENNRIIFFTSSGMIIGTPVEREVDKSEVLPFLVDSAVKHYRETHGIDSFLPGNDGLLVLKNVEVRGNPNITLPYLVLFYDQIIGMAIGNPA